MKPLHQIRVALWARRCSDLPTIEKSLAGVGCQVNRVESFDALEHACKEASADLLIVPCHSAREVLQWMRSATGPAAASRHIPVLTLASALDVDLYLEAMQLGAFDCAGLPLEHRELTRLIERAVESSRMAMSV